jgi:hypothetical protein
MAVWTPDHRRPATWERALSILERLMDEQRSMYIIARAARFHGDTFLYIQVLPLARQSFTEFPLGMVSVFLLERHKRRGHGGEISNLLSSTRATMSFLGND